MKKFKVIEPSRFLTNEAMQQTKGGCSTFTGCGTYDDCGLIGGHVSCRPGGAGYETCSGSYGTLCDMGQIYSSCAGKTYTSCPASTKYLSHWEDSMI